jgi:hypothetical protein
MAALQEAVEVGYPSGPVRRSAGTLFMRQTPT